MAESMITVGVHIGHDGGAAIARDGQVVYAIAEERLSRVKYANGWWSALRYCLDASRVQIRDVDLVVFSNAGTPLPAEFDGGLHAWGLRAGRVENVDHHVAHAFGGYCFSGMNSGTVLVCDAGGNLGVTESIHAFSGNDFEMLKSSSLSRPRCKGIGPTYEAFTNYLGFSDQESGKTMALAAYGDSSDFRDPLFEFNDDTGEVFGRLNRAHQVGVVEFLREAGVAVSPFQEWRNPWSQALAHYAQRELEGVLCRLAEYAIRKTGMPGLCLSGGVGLNSIANARLRELRPFRPTFFFPVCSDTGLALGDALYGQWLLSGEIPRQRDLSMLFGRPYAEAELLAALRREPMTTPPARLRSGDFSFRRSRDIVEEVAQRLIEGQTVAWFQGGSECGPRALGARSILKLPDKERYREELNSLKGREWFRPFGPAVLRGDAKSLLNDPCDELRYMIEAPRVSAMGTTRLAACTHVDGTSRVQVVDSIANERFGDLLLRIKQGTGVGAVMNTSFNVHEPIVESPGDAIRTFLSLGIDFLALEDYGCTLDRW